VSLFNSEVEHFEFKFSSKVSMSLERSMRRRGGRSSLQNDSGAAVNTGWRYLQMSTLMQDVMWLKQAVTGSAMAAHRGTPSVARQGVRLGLAWIVRTL
jgi:hypothetical protein